MFWGTVHLFFVLLLVNNDVIGPPDLILPRARELSRRPWSGVFFSLPDVDENLE